MPIKKLCALVALLTLLTPNLALARPNTLNYGEQGGARSVVGGSLDVVSGGEIDVESGAAFKIAGTAVSASAAELNQADADSQGSDGLMVTKVARVTFDCGNGSGCPVGATASTVSLPAKAVIIRSYLRITTQLADTGTCTQAISCEDANNIKTATDMTGSAAGAFVEGQSTGAASAFISSIAASCAITLTVADGGSCVPSAGKLTAWVHYIVHD